MLFPRLVQQYAAGSLQVRNTSEELAVLVCRASQCGCPEACLALLDLAAAQQLTLSAEEAFALLRAAAQEGQPAVVMDVTERYGSELFWRLASQHGVAIHRTVVHAMATHLLGQLTAGALQLDSTRLGLLVVKAAACQETQVSVALLQAAAKQQAARFDQAAILELLLGAGALLDAELASVAVRSYSDTCVALLLKLGPLPVDLSRRVWNRRKDDTRVLRTLEALLAAGHRPTVYRDVRLQPGAQPVAVFDPIIEQPFLFSRTNVDRWLWLALGGEGWTFATHQQQPPMLKLAYQAVLLSAACSQKAQRVQAQGTDTSPHKLQRLAAAGSATSKASTISCSSAVLGCLPNELLLHVLRLAARPLSAWLPYSGNDEDEDDYADE
ncbi:hypothetical protein N2152v2_002930 [Parachlorella kessleri]